LRVGRVDNDNDRCYRFVVPVRVTGDFTYTQLKSSSTFFSNKQMIFARQLVEQPYFSTATFSKIKDFVQNLLCLIQPSMFACCFVLFALFTLVARVVVADKCTELSSQACYGNDACCLYTKVINTAICGRMVNGVTTTYPPRSGLSNGCQCIRADCAVPPTPAPPPPSYCSSDKSSAECRENAKCCYLTNAAFGVCLSSATGYPGTGYSKVTPQPMRTESEFLACRVAIASRVRLTIAASRQSRRQSQRRSQRKKKKNCQNCCVCVCYTIKLSVPLVARHQHQYPKPMHQRQYRHASRPTRPRRRRQRLHRHCRRSRRRCIRCRRRPPPLRPAVNNAVPLLAACLDASIVAVCVVCVCGPALMNFRQRCCELGVCGGNNICSSMSHASITNAVSSSLLLTLLTFIGII
jgi:hypothetical protein